MIITVCTAGKATADSRVYSREILQAQVDRLKPVVDRRAMLGELDSGDNSFNCSIVRLNTVSHSIDRLWMDGDNLMAEVSIMDTIPGKTLRSIIGSNPDAVAFKMIGTGGGRIESDGFLHLHESYKLIRLQAVYKN